MEAIGAAASIAALAEIAIKSYRAASQLTKDVQNAPKELSRLTHQLEVLQCELSLLCEFERSTIKGDELVLLPTEIKLLERALLSANGQISELCSYLSKLQLQKPGRRARLQWGLKDKAQAQDLLKGLGHIEGSLTNVLLLVNVRLSSFSSRVAASMREAQKVNSLSRSSASIRHQASDVTFLPRRTLSSLFDRNPQSRNSFYGSWCSAKTPFLTWLGLQILLTSYGNDIHNTVFLSVKFRPWGVFESKSICFNLGLRALPLANLGVSIPRADLAVKPLVPEDSGLMRACQQGDVLTVRGLFASRRASPYEVTPSNSTPLRYAIESGSLDMVRFLCYHGADVNATFGRFETSPLEWAFRSRQIEIARFFLAQGASLDYLCYRGWTPAMLLFQPTFPEAPHQFFELLSCYSFSDFDVQDRCGATALHRAASWGTEADVHALLQLGASPMLTDTDVGWTPAFQAAQMNNISTLKRLASDMPPDFVQYVDFNCRTILHAAVEASSLDAITFLIELGADPHLHTRTKSEDSTMGEGVSLIDFARSQGQTTYEHVLRVLRTLGHSISTKMEADEKDIFWDVPEVQGIT